MSHLTVETYENGVLIETRQSEWLIVEPSPAAVSAVTRWRSMGFSDDEIIAMIPALADAVTYAPTD
jgi:hypothetical protein